MLRSSTQLLSWLRVMEMTWVENIYGTGMNTALWIKELGTAAPYGCNNQIKGVGTLRSPSCKHTNVLGIFNKPQ